MRFHGLFLWNSNDREEVFPSSKLPMFQLDAFLLSPKQQGVLTTCNMRNAYVCSRTKGDRDKNLA